MAYLLILIGAVVVTSLVVYGAISFYRNTNKDTNI